MYTLGNLTLVPVLLAAHASLFPDWIDGASIKEQDPLLHLLLENSEMLKKFFYPPQQ